jgi:hypothetical protein
LNSYLVSMDFNLILRNESRRLRTNLHLHVIFVYELVCLLRGMKLEIGGDY